MFYSTNLFYIVMILVVVIYVLLWQLSLYIFGFVLLVHFVLAPLLFKYSIVFQRNLIYLNFVKWPMSVDYTDPSILGVDGTRNINIVYNSVTARKPIQLGVWHTLPRCRYESLKDDLNSNRSSGYINAVYEREMINSGKPVIMYCHGNSNHRGATHRIKLYKILSEMDYHVVSFDYRGYGDSTNITPTELGVVEDTLNVYKYICDVLSKADTQVPVYIWGHSLGTGISSHMVGNLSDVCARFFGHSESLQQCAGLILEAPFNNLKDEVGHYPLTLLVKWLPYFEATFVRPFDVTTDYCFKSDRHLTRADNVPVLVLHAKDDMVVPHLLGKKLFEHLQCSRAKSQSVAPTHMKSYKWDLGLGHKWICNAEDLRDTVVGFMNDCDHYRLGLTKAE